MHAYSLESFLKSKYAALRKHKTIFFMALLAMTIFSVYLILAAVFQASADVTTIEPFNLTYNVINFTVNNTQAAVNITQFNITLPTGFGFNASSNGSSPLVSGITGVANFSYYGNTLNWINNTFGLINGTSINNRSFWIGINSSVEGIYGINVTIKYDNGTIESFNQTMTVNDTIVPTFSNQLPGPNNFTSDTTPTVYINITDGGMGVNTSTIVLEVSKNAAPFANVIETITAITNGFQVSYTYITGLASGDNFTIRVNARDNSSNANAMTEAKWNITADTASPNVSVISPSADTNLTGASDNITVQVNDTWPTSVNTSDIYAAIKNSTGYYALDNSGTKLTGSYQTWTRLYQSGSTSFFNATLNSNIFKDGTYTLYINATDLAGNMLENSTRKITIDNTAPTAFTLNTPANNTNSTIRTPTLTWETVTEANFINYTIQIATDSAFTSINETREVTDRTTGTVTMSTLASDGTFWWRVTATDAAGNTRTNSSFIYITDNTAPTIGITAPSADTNLTGSADNINVTVNENVSAVYGAMKHSNSSYYQLDGTYISYIGGGDFRNWTNMTRINATAFTFPLNSDNLADATYTLYINASDFASNNGTSSTRKITIDNTAPVVAYAATTTADASNVTATSIFTNITYNETNFASITFYIYYSNGSINETRRYTNSTNFTNITLSEGTYSFSATVSDAAGNNGSVSNRTVTLDTTAPVVSYAAVTPSDASNRSINSIFVNITYNETNYASIIFYLYNSNGAINTIRTHTNFTNFTNFTGLADGTYLFSATVNDTANNPTALSNRTVTLDTTVPSAFNLIVPTNATISTNRTPTLQWESTNEINFVNYTMQIDDNSDFSSLVNTTGTYANATNKTGVTGTTLGADTVYYWRVTAWDAADNSRAAPAFTYTTDNTVPIINITVPANNSNLTGAADNLTVQVVDTNINNTAVWVALFNSTNHYNLDATAVVGDYRNFTKLKVSSGDFYNATINSNNFADGSYRINLTAVDLAGNINSNSSINITIDNNGPSSSDLTPANATFTNTQTPTIYINITDTASKVDNNSIEFQIKVNAGAWVNVTTYTNATRKNIPNGIQVSYTAEPLSDGDVVRVYVDAKDMVANSMTRANWSFTIDLIALVITIGAPSTNNTNQTASDVNITAQITDTNRNNSDVWAALKNTTAYYTLAGVQATGDYRTWTNLVRSGSSNFFNNTLNANNFADGEYRIYVNASDLGGNLVENKSLVLHIDNTPPLITLSTPDTFANTSVTNMSFVWTANDSQDTSLTCNLTLNSVVNRSNFEASNNTAVANLSVSAAGLSNGTHTWNVTCIDDVKNINTSATRTFYVETGAPTVTLNAPANLTNSSSTTIKVNWTATSSTYSTLYCNVSLDNIAINNSVSSSIAVTNGTNNNWYNFTGLSQGVHNGNVTCWSPVYTTTSSTNTFTVDTTAPSVTLISPSPANLTNISSTTPTVAFNVSDNLAANFTCELFADGGTSKGTNWTVNNDTNADALQNGTIVSSALSQATHTFYVNCSDYAGNTGRSQIRTITVDATAPVVSYASATPADASNISATSIFTNITYNETNFASITFYIYYSNGSINETRRYTNSTNFTNITLSEGTYSFSATVSDAAGNNGSVSNRTVTLDTTAPVVSYAAVTPSDASNRSINSIFVNITYNETNYQGIIFYLYNSNGAINTIRTHTNFTNFTNFTGLADGTYLFSATVNDTANNPTALSNRTVTLDTTAPVLQIRAPANNTNQTTTEAVNVTVNITDTNWNVSDVWASLKTGSTYYNLNGTQATGDYRTWSRLDQSGTSAFFNGTLNASNFSDGTYTIYANTSDAAENSGTAPLMTIVIDKTAPVIQNISYNNASVGTSVGITFNVTDATSGVSGATAAIGNCTIYFNATLMASILYSSAKGGCNTSFTVPGTFTPGNYTLGINVTDWANNNGTNTSYRIQIFSDTEAPTITVSAPANNTNQSSTSLNVSWTATDNIDTSLGGLGCNITIGNTNTTTSATSGTLNSTLVTVSAGDNQFVNVSCWDDATNNNKSATYTFTIDNTNPVVAFAAVTPSDASNRSINSIFVNITYNETNYQSLTFYLYNSNGALNTARTHTNFTNFTNFTGLADGTYLFSATVTDSSGNNGTVSNRSVTLDTTSPVAAYAAVTPVDLSNRSISSIFVNITYNETNFASITFYVYYSNASINTTRTHTNFTNFTNVTLSDETYSFSATVTDAAGNNNSVANRTVTLDTTAPTVTLQIANNTNQTSATFIANWSVTDNLDNVFECDIYLNSARNTTTAVGGITAGTNANRYNISGLAQGNFNWYANCSDSASNVGTSSSRQFTVDSSVPAVTINQPEADDFNRSSLLINVTATDAYTNVTNTTLQYRFVNTSGIGNTTVWDNFTLTTMISATVTYDVTTLIDGTYTIQVRANDTVNNQNATANVSITIDNTAPALTSWNYSSISKNLTLVFNETMDPSSIDLSKIAVNYSDYLGTPILTRITAGSVVTSSNSSTLSTTINISLGAADYNELDPHADENMKLTIQANAIRDRAGSNVVANYTKITAWTKHTIRRPEAYGNTYSQNTWVSPSFSFTALQNVSSLGSNYNVTNVLASMRGSYTIFYAYNFTSGSWLAYEPGVGGTFANFTSTTDSRAYEIYMNRTDALEIV